MRNLGRWSSQTCTTDTSHPPTSPGTDLADVAYQKHPCGGLAGRYFQHWKSQSLAPVSENCVFLGSKFYPKSFLKKSRFTKVLEPFVGQLHFLPPHLRLFFQLLGSRSQHAIRAVLCWSLLILPFFLVWMPGGSLSLIFFHVQLIPPVCTLKAGFGPRPFEQFLQQRDSLSHVSTGMSLTRGMPLHHQSPSKIPVF